MIPYAEYILFLELCARIDKHYQVKYSELHKCLKLFQFVLHVLNKFLFESLRELKFKMEYPQIHLL